MQSNSKKEDTNAKKKYVFFTDPDIIVQRAETSAAVSQFYLFVFVSYVLQ